MTLFEIYLVTLVTATISSMPIFFKSGKIHLRLLAVIIFVTLATEILANYCLELLPFRTRNAVYNIFMLFEFSGFLFFYYMVITNRILKCCVVIAIVAIVIVWIYYSVGAGKSINNWNNQFVMVAFLMTIMIAAAYCYQLFITEELIDFSKHPEFWISLALITFYTINFPYLAMYQFVIVQYEIFAEELKLVLQVTNCILYLIISYAFILNLWNIRKSKL